MRAPPAKPLDTDPINFHVAYSYDFTLLAPSAKVIISEANALMTGLRIPVEIKLPSTDNKHVKRDVAHLEKKSNNHNCL